MVSCEGSIGDRDRCDSFVALKKVIATIVLGIVGLASRDMSILCLPPLRRCFLNQIHPGKALNSAARTVKGAGSLGPKA